MKRFLTVFLGFFLAITLSHAGIYYKVKTTTEILDAKAKEQVVNSPYGDMTAPMIMEVYVKDKTKFKGTVLEGGSVFIPKGTVIISLDGKLIYFLNPQNKTYWKINAESLKTMGESAMKMMKKFAKMKYSDIYVGIVPIENGGKIAGYNTDKYKVVVKYTVMMKILFKKMKTPIKQESEIYATKDFSINDFDVYTFQNMFSTGIPEIDSQIHGKLKTIGFPLKTVNYSYNKDKLESITTFEILEIKKTSVSDKMFKIPSDYTEQPSPFEQALGQAATEQSGEQPEQSDEGQKKFNLKELFQ